MVELIETFTNILQPVIEKSIIFAGNYTKASGRTCITSKDIEYSSKYTIMNRVGEDIGSLFPEIYDSEESDESDIEEVDEDDPSNVFVRYTGSEQLYNDINNAYDTWDEWEPQSPAETLLKNAIDSSD